MSYRQRMVFFIRTVLAGVAGLLALVTLVWREWIEWLFGIDPDGGSGYLEWLIVAALVVTAVGMGLLAERQWRRRSSVVHET